MAAATVNLVTYTDADYAQAFRQSGASGDYRDFTGCAFMMMVRKSADDPEVFLSLTSKLSGLRADESGIDLYEPATGDGLIEFAVVIVRDDLQKIPAGQYVHSLIVVTPEGLHDDLWRGTLTHNIGPTR